MDTKSRHRLMRLFTVEINGCQWTT